MKVIGFYTTDTPYEQEAEEFKKSLDEYSIPYHLYPVDNKGKWEINCSLKSKILRRAIDEHDDNILYLDVDARVVRQPPFEKIEKDIPGFIVWHPSFRPEGQLSSAVIYLPNNSLSRKLLDAWIQEQEKDLMVWDQDALFNVYKKFNHFLLDHDWNNIKRFRKDKPLIETKNPIFMHTQASRRNKNKL